MFLHRRQNEVQYGAPVPGAPEIKVTGGENTVDVGQGGGNASSGNEQQGKEGDYNTKPGAGKANENTGDQPPAKSGSFGHGVVYTPYHDDNQCKSEDQIQND